MQSTVLHAEVQRGTLSIIQKSGDKIVACTTVSRGESGMGGGSHVDVIEKLGYYLGLKKMTLQSKNTREVG